MPHALWSQYVPGLNPAGTVPRATGVCATSSRKCVAVFFSNQNLHLTRSPIVLVKKGAPASGWNVNKHVCTCTELGARLPSAVVKTHCTPAAALFMFCTLGCIAQAVEFKYFPPKVTRGQVKKAKLAVPNARAWFHVFALGKLCALLGAVAGGLGVAQLLGCACCHLVRNAFETQRNGQTAGGAALHGRHPAGCGGRV